MVGRSFSIVPRSVTPERCGCEVACRARLRLGRFVQRGHEGVVVFAGIRNSRRSANVSSAALMPLSRIKALMLWRRTAAARCNSRLAVAVRRTSSRLRRRVEVAMGRTSFAGDTVASRTLSVHPHNDPLDRTHGGPSQPSSAPAAHPVSPIYSHCQPTEAPSRTFRPCNPDAGSWRVASCLRVVHGSEHPRGREAGRCPPA